MQRYLKSLIPSLIFLFGNVVFLYSQDSSKIVGLNGLWSEVKLQNGAIFPHHSSVSYIMEENITGVDITFSTESKNRHYWESAFRNPRYGAGYSLQRVGNKDVLGNMHALYGYIDVPFHTPKRNHVFSYQLNIGVGYFTERYHPYDNPLNHLVSAKLNAYVGVDLAARYKVGKKNEVKTALELTHCSNGKTKTPNLGVNMVTLSASWMYSLKPAQSIVKPEPLLNYKKHYFELIANGGGKRDDNMSDIVYFVSSFVADYYYAYSPKYLVGLGGDIFYDASLAQHEEFFEEGSSAGSMNTQVGLHAGFRVRYNKISFVANVGHYVVYDYLRHGKVYTRIGMRYAVSEQILLNLTLKAHSTIADFIEWGVGYRFKTAGR